MIASTVAHNASTTLAPLSANSSRNLRCLRARAPMIASAYTYSQLDLIIAATALHHGLTVVTRDTADFRRARVPVLNPWNERAR